MNILYTYVTTKNVDIAYSEFSKEELMECILALRTTYFRLKEEYEQLKEIIKENTILVKDEYGDYQECNINPLGMKQEYDKQVDNWNKLKEHMTNAEQIYKESDDKYVKDMREMGIRHAYKIILYKMQELEESDINE